MDSCCCSPLDNTVGPFGHTITISEACVAVARVSTQKQGAEGGSLDQQLERIREMCKARGLEIVKEFKIMESGFHQQRKIFSEMEAFCKKAKINKLALYSIDRACRDMKKLVEIVETFELHIVLFPGLEQDTPGGRLAIYQLGAVYECVSRENGHKTRAGILKRKEIGFCKPLPTCGLCHGAGIPGGRCDCQADWLERHTVGARKKKQKYIDFSNETKQKVEEVLNSTVTPTKKKGNHAKAIAILNEKGPLNLNDIKWTPSSFSNFLKRSGLREAWGYPKKQHNRASSSSTIP